MYRPRFNSFIDNRQNFFNSGQCQQWHMNNRRNNYNPNRFNHPQPYGVSSESHGFNNDFWCETCDRGFRTQYILESHKKEHQKCNIDGCQFIAHPKVITKHIQMQHSTGLYKRIAKLNNPDEIAKWREERRKKYPTKDNIEKKNLEIQAKIQRGEKMDMKFSRKRDINQKRNGDLQSNSRRNSRLLKRKFPLRSPTKTPVPNKVIKLELDEQVRPLKPFGGIQHLIEDAEDRESSLPETKYLIEDDEFTNVQNKIELESKTVVICKALESLVNDYGSSDEEVKKEELIISNNINTDKNYKILANTNKEIVIEQTNQTHTVKSHIETEQKDILNHCLKTTQIDEEDDDSGPEEMKIDKETNAPITIKNTNERKPRQELINKNKDKHRIHENNQINNRNQYKRKLPSTLLEKLLSSEIRKERNIVLQCIRYIIRNDYFNKINKN